MPQKSQPTDGYGYGGGFDGNGYGGGGGGGNMGGGRGAGGPRGGGPKGINLHKQKASSNQLFIIYQTFSEHPSYPYYIISSTIYYLL